MTATGQLDPVINVAVGSQISGLIQKLYVDFNSTVKSNQIIAEIDPITYKMNLLKAEADLANARANMNLAKVQAVRSSALFSNKLVSASDNDIAQAQLEQAEAQVQSSEALRENVKVDLAHCTIYAPVDGVVISRNVDVGQTVAASFNTPTLFSIANDLAKMQIDALVSEADIGGVAASQTVNFTVDAYPYRTFTGNLSQIRYGSITNQNVISYDSVVAVSNADLKLLPGMTANVSIITRRTNQCAQDSQRRLAIPPAGRDQYPAAVRVPGRPPGHQRRGSGWRPLPRRRPLRSRSRPDAARTAHHAHRLCLAPQAGGRSRRSAQTQTRADPSGDHRWRVTEVLAGLHEGDRDRDRHGQQRASRSGGPPSNPFGGGPRRF